MKTNQESGDDVIVRCGGCKRIVFWAANLPQVMTEDVYSEIGRMVSDGCTVEHVKTDEARKGKWGCKCK